MNWEQELEERRNSNKGIILIGSAMFNWSETQRMTGLGLELYNRGYYIVFIGKGKYDYLLNENPFERKYIEADDWWFTKDRVIKMMDIGRYGNNYASLEEIEEMIAQEVTLIKEVKPLIMITGYRTTFKVSAQMAGISLVWCLSAVVSPMYFEQGLANIPEQQMLYIENFMKKNRPEENRQEIYKKLTKKYVLTRNKTSVEWNQYLMNHNLPVFQCDLDMFKGELNLMSDAEELFPTIPANLPDYKFCGPILAKENIPMPECVLHHKKKKGKKVVFMVMGSSGEKKVFLQVLRSMKETDYDVFVATVGIISEEETKEFPSNFYFAEKYPLIEMMKYADAAIIHGGQGTVYSTILGAKPFVGIPMFNEQQYNLENLIRTARCGIILLKNQVEEKSMKKALDDIMTKKEYAENMRRMNRKISRYYYDKAWDANVSAVNHIESLLYANTM